MIEYTVVDMRDAVDMVKPMLKTHWKETETFQDKIDLDPDFDKYIELADAGNAMCCVALVGENIAGYAVFLIGEDLHHKGVIRAQTDAIYINESYRNIGAGEGLINYCEEKLKELGVQIILLTSKTENSFETLCDRLGYANIESVHGKYIGD